MDFKVSDFLGPNGRDALLSERRGQYERDAVGFLRREFAPATRLLTDDCLTGVVQLAHRNAKASGVTGDRNHLKYLVPVMFWGSGFETDPQYFYDLNRARWRDSHGNRTGVWNVDDVIAQVNRRQNAVVQDSADGQRILNGFGRIYRRQDLPPASRDDAHRAMLHIWPCRYGLMVPQQREVFINLNMAHAAEIRFSGADAVTYVCLAMYLGSGFHKDPRYPWVAASLANVDATPEERRVAFGDAVLKYWVSMGEG